MIKIHKKQLLIFLIQKKLKNQINSLNNFTLFFLKRIYMNKNNIIISSNNIIID